MRIKILIEAEAIPLLYRHRILSLIKEALEKGDASYKDFLYNSKTAKPFTFNLVPPITRSIEEKEIRIDDKFSVKDRVFYSKGSYFSLFVSSIDERFILSLFKGLKKMDSFQFSYNNYMIVDGKSITLRIKRIIMINEKDISKDSAVFKTSSPFLLEDKNDNPVLFYEKHFEKELNEITDKILSSSHIKGKGLEKPLKFEPIQMNKQVVKHTLRAFREKTNKPIMYLTANAGVFKLEGHPTDLDILYKIGIGNRTGQGFGMLELLEY